MRLLQACSALSLILAAAMFGFFYAWVCSTMWGLDAADPRVAIAAMQAMNASVRNAVFAPVFFGAAPLVLLTAALGYGKGARMTGAWFAAAGVLLAASVVLTAAVNVPMNEALAVLEVPADRATGAAIWADYSPRWQVWNITRTVLSGAGVLFLGLGLMRLPART